MSNKLQGKDLINIGIFAAIYFVVVFAVSMLGVIPIFIPLLDVLVPLIGGIPMSSESMMIRSLSSREKMS